MKNRLMSFYDRIMLRKRSVIETINDELKNICEVEPGRHLLFLLLILFIISNCVVWRTYNLRACVQQLV